MDPSGTSKSTKKRRSKGKRTSEGSGEDSKGEIKSPKDSKNVISPLTTKKETAKTTSSVAEVVATHQDMPVKTGHEPKSIPPVTSSVLQDTNVVAEKALEAGDVKDKSREDIKAEREAKKLAKQMRKKGIKETPGESNDSTPVSNNSATSTTVGSTDTTPILSKIAESGLSRTLDNFATVTSNACSLVESVKVSEINPAEGVKPQDKPEKSKAELRAERRAKQEAQRAEKEAQKKVPSGKKEESAHKKDKLASPATVKPSLKTEETPLKIITKDAQIIQETPKFRHKLFDHLERNIPIDVSTVRWEQAVEELGAQYASRVVAGSTARTVALLGALRRLIADHRPAAKTDFARSLDSALGKASARLARSRPPAVAMTNAMRHLKSHVNHLTTSPLPDDEAKKKLCEVIDTYIKEQVEVACLAISNTAQQKISNGDVILTYGCSSVVLRSLEQAHQNGKHFSVIVADGGPWYEGREMLRRLAAASIPTSYILVTAATFVMRKVHKVMLGAHALLANGCVMSRAGTSMVALAAHARGVPVLVLCETHKFSDRVQADAFVYNELGESGITNTAEEHKNLTCLSLVYDITPPELVTAVVTELAILPCTSVPVVLRVKPADLH